MKTFKPLALFLLAASHPAFGQQGAAADEFVFARPLRDIPGLQILYYDVNGSDIKSLNRSLKERRGSGSAGTDWNVVVGLDKRTEGSVCTITGSSVKFSATATLPRLAGEAADESLQLAWQVYVSGVEEDLAAKLWFAYDRVKQIEQTFVGKPCEQGSRDGAAAIAQLRSDFAALSARPAPMPE